jgi:hypothetical protein
VTTSYMLELTEPELLHLWALLSMYTLSPSGLENEEQAILEKVTKLMEGK